MAVNFLIIVALLQMGACVPAPEPDPHNIDIQISQVVNTGCGNGGCPPKPVCCKNGVDGTCRKECESGEYDSGDGCEKDGQGCDYKCCRDVWPVLLPRCDPATCWNSTTDTTGICNVLGLPNLGWTDAGVEDCKDGCECDTPPATDVCNPTYCRSSWDDHHHGLSRLVWGICLVEPPPFPGWTQYGFGCDFGCDCYIASWQIPSPIPVCWFDDMKYENGSFRVRSEECLVLQCVNGRWDVYEIDPECGNCTFGGEPIVYTFDPLDGSKRISVWGIGEYVMTQPGFLISRHPGFAPPAAFGVNGQFTNTPSSFCGNTAHTTCIDGATYYETDIAVKIILQYSVAIPRFVGFKVFWKCLRGGCPSGWQGPSTGPPMGNGKNLFGLSVFKVNVIIGGGQNCILVTGSQGLAVAVCETSFGPKGYPWAYIYAMPRLRSPISQLYGLCNTWTGVNQTYFTDQNGTHVYDWQNGTSLDHDNVTHVRKLSKDSTEQWKVPAPPGTTTNSPTPTTTTGGSGK